MDQYKLIMLIAENPQLWDHKHEHFRNQHLKTTTWDTIAHSLCLSVHVCKEAFKALREKYLREKSKQLQQGSQWKNWELFDYLRFLEPHIVPRRNYLSSNEGPYSESTEFQFIDHENQTDQKYIDTNTYSFCRELIILVYKCNPLWDRENKDNYDKQLKLRLWGTVAQALRSDINTCMLKWKGLREKYIRQKQKYTEGKEKWEFLDDLSFLDSVIHYRRKQWQVHETDSLTDSQIDQFSSDCEIIEPATEQISLLHCDDVLNKAIKKEYTSSNMQTNHYKNCAPDSTLDTSRQEFSCASRKRTSSETSDTSSENKRNKRSERNKAPEQIFGEFVAATLATKTEAEKNFAMVQIMQILMKTN